MDVGVKDRLPGILATVHADIEAADRGIGTGQFVAQFAQQGVGVALFGLCQAEVVFGMALGNDEQMPLCHCILVADGVAGGVLAHHVRGVQQGAEDAFLRVVFHVHGVVSRR